MGLFGRGVRLSPISTTRAGRERASRLISFLGAAGDENARRRKRKNSTLVLTGHLLLRSAVFVGQDSRNQQKGGSQERPPARNKEKRDARHRQQHRSHDGNEQCQQRADKPDQDDKQTEKNEVTG